MGANTRIEWCDHTFNPVVGCTKVSPACDNCYAESWAKRTGQPELWQGKVRRTTPQNWRQPLKWNGEAAASGRRAKVFCASLSDVFDNQWEPVWRADLMRLILDTPHLNWLLLTKRPQNIASMCGTAMPDNVWLGITAENQTEFDRRWPFLEAIQVNVRLVSYEPALGPLSPFLGNPYSAPDWIICGGESGPGARPMLMSWMRSIIEQCRSAGVPCFVKQMGRTAIDDIIYVGASPDLRFRDAKGGDQSEWPKEFRIREFPVTR